MNNKFSFNDFIGLCSILKEYDESYVKFFGKVNIDGQIGESSISGIINVDSDNTFHSITIGNEDDYTLKIVFVDNAILKVYQHNEIISEYELLDVYMEFPLIDKNISRGWKPSDETYYPSDSKNTKQLSICESDFYKKVSEVILENSGFEIKLWILAFDEEPTKVKEILHDEILVEPNLKGYYFQGTVNPQDGGIPTIETDNGTISISYHSYIGAPMILNYDSGQQIMISDLYIKVNEQVIQPKNLNTDKFVWNKA